MKSVQVRFISEIVAKQIVAENCQVDICSLSRSIRRTRFVCILYMKMLVFGASCAGAHFCDFVALELSLTSDFVGSELKLSIDKT